MILSKAWESLEPCHFAHTLPSRQLAPNKLVNRINGLKTNIYIYVHGMLCGVYLHVCVTSDTYLPVSRCGDWITDQGVDPHLQS